MSVKIIDGILQCPNCSSHHPHDYLHHHQIAIFSRQREDAPTKALVVSAHHKMEKIAGEDTEFSNPSSRRDGIIIRFSCEGCHGDLFLTIAQHKGNTHVGWKVGQKPSPFALGNDYDDAD